MHYEQSHPDSCVAAAMCIVQRWRGLVPTEDAFYAANTARSPMFFLNLPRVVSRTIGVGDEREIELALRLGKLVGITVMATNYSTWVSSTHPNLRSAHGVLTGFLHMIMLVGRGRDTYTLLDPFFAAHGQPLQVTDDEFMTWFAGHAFMVSR